MTYYQQLTALGLLSLTLGAAGCSDSDDSMDDTDMNETAGSSAANNTDDLDPQVPPSNAADMARWLVAFEDEGWIDDWACEAAATDKTEGDPAIHVHGTSNRVCSNATLAAATLSGDAKLSEGAAGVKFTGDGIFVEVKVQADSAGGDGWFWYAPGGAVAETGASECIGCHSAAGSDADHPGLGDYVYFQVTL